MPQMVSETLARLAHEDRNVPCRALSVVGVKGEVLIAYRPEQGLLVGCSEAGTELHAAAAVAHHDLGMLYEVVIPDGVAGRSAKRCDQKHTVPVREVHERQRQDTVALRPFHRDEANLPAPETVEKPAAAHAIQIHLDTREGLDYPMRKARAC